MLAYILNNKFLWLDSSTSVVIINRNPACFFDSLQNCAALGVDIPVNSRNSALLGNPERFEKLISKKERKFEGFEIRYDGALLIKGTLVIKSANDETYSGWVQSDLGALGEAQQEKYINEMPWPENKTFVSKETYNDDSDDYGLIAVHNRNFWEGKGREEELEVSYFDTSGSTQVKNETRSVIGYNFHKEYGDLVNNYDLTEIKEGCVISPFLHRRYVIRESLRMNGFHIDRNDMTAGIYDLSYLKNQMIYNNFNIVDVNITTTTRTRDLWDYDRGRQYFKDFDEIDSEKTWFVGNFNYADLLPRKSYKDFLLGQQNMDNYIFHFRVDGFVDVIDRNNILNRPAIDLNKYFRGVWEPGEQKNRRIKFVVNFDKDDGKYSDEFEDLSDRWQDFEDPVATMTDLEALASPEFGELRLVEETNKIYEYGWNVEKAEDAQLIEEQLDTVGWKFVSNGPQHFIYGDGDEEEEIETAISTTQQRTFSGLGYNFFIPLVVQKGNINKMRSLWNDFTIRFLPANSALHGKSLYWEGEFGLFNQRWKNWAEFWVSRLDVNAKFQLPLNAFTHVRDNITEPFRTNKGEFIIEETETEFGMHRIGETKIKGYKK